jgi:hypothetical protein
VVAAVSGFGVNSEKFQIIFGTRIILRGLKKERVNASRAAMTIYLGDLMIYIGKSWRPYLGRVRTNSLVIKYSE